MDLHPLDLQLQSYPLTQPLTHPMTAAEVQAKKQAEEAAAKAAAKVMPADRQILEAGKPESALMSCVAKRIYIKISVTLSVCVRSVTRSLCVIFVVFRSTGGESWKNKSGWMTSADIGTPHAAYVCMLPYSMKSCICRRHVARGHNRCAR